MKSIQVNPFIIGAYAGSHYFCDCERETDELVQDLTNVRNVVLVAQRRMGKTGLLLHTFHQEKISKHYNVFFIDIFATASVREFVYAFGNAIIDQLKPRDRKFLDRFLQIITSLRPAAYTDTTLPERTLHQLEILTHEFLGYVMSGFRVMLMNIDTLELNRLPIEQ